MLLLNSFIFALFLAVPAAVGEAPIVETANGKVQAKILTTFTNKTFYAFQGIPYAKPPIGDLRFKPPQAPENWDGILDDRGVDRMCIQLSSETSPKESEDCLYLQVYTPQIPSENVSLPVMYAIHGGAFVIGEPGISQMGPHLIMDYDVILVSVGYRLGFFGYLATGDLESPGNNGFKDQQYGLRWVQENIAKFGGDPTRVTLFGESAGAASVGYQLLGSNAEGLFRGAIQDSGSSLGSWTLQRNPRGIAFQLANLMNSSINETNTTTRDLVDFLRTAEIPDIKKACVDLFGEGMIGGFYTTLAGFVFSGTVEPEHDGAFLTDLPYQKLQSGNFNLVPILIGVNSEENLFLASDENLKQRMKNYDENTDMLVLPDMHLTDKDLMKMIGNNIRKFYVDQGLMQDNLGPTIKYFTDTTFIRPSLKQARLAYPYTDVYFYEFSYSGKMGQGPLPRTDIPGAEKVAHGEEMYYMFHPYFAPDPYSFGDDDVLTMKRMLTMWTNFVKFLNPTPEPLEILSNIIWPKVDLLMPYLSINRTLEIREEYKPDMVNLYDVLYDTYAVPPLDTF